MQFIVFSGLPGTGKSSLAEATGRTLHIPVFAKDWLEASLLRSGLGKDSNLLGFAGYELLTTLALRQMQLKQSVILDSVASTRNIRQQWRELAANHEADWRVIECICSDPTIHRARLETRERKITGWHELTWVDVERVRGHYETWTEDRLIVDMVKPLVENLHEVLTFLEQG